MLADHHKREDDPNENQHNIQHEEGLGRKGKKLDPDEDRNGRNPVTHADEE